MASESPAARWSSRPAPSSTRSCSAARSGWRAAAPASSAAVPLAGAAARIGLAQGRLKTGTPPRLDGRTIDWARLRPQPSDARRLDDVGARRRLATAAAAGLRDHPHQLRAPMTSSAPDFDRSPLFAGAIEGRGPRYCPSIEDKVRRFGDRDGHQIFLEPEGLDDRPGLSQRHLAPRLPADVQQAFVDSIAGLERCRIVRPGYAVEYEYADRAQARLDARASRSSAACSSPARSTAPPAMRRRRRRAWSPG